MAKLFPDLKVFLLLTLTCLIIFILDNYHFLSGIKFIAYSVTNPISFGLYTVGTNLQKQLYFIYSLRLAAQENRALKQQINQLMSENASLKRQFLEAQSQITQDKHLDPRTYNLIPARPIGLDRNLRIDKGLSSGIKVGMAVVSNDNFVGKVVQVFEKSSNVQLLTDPDSKVSAFSLGKDGKARGILQGQFGSEALMDKILHEEKVAIGDLVYSEGSEGYLPRGLILGKVSEIIEKQDELFKQAKVKQTFDTKDLELVFVIKE